MTLQVPSTLNLSQKTFRQFFRERFSPEVRSKASKYICAGVDQLQLFSYCGRDGHQPYSGGLNTHYIEGFPIKGGMTIPHIATFDPRTYTCCTYDMFIYKLHGSREDLFQLCSRQYKRIFTQGIEASPFFGKRYLFPSADNCREWGQPNTAPENQ